MSIEERLERLERLLEEVLRRLNELETRLGGGEAEAMRAAARLVSSSIASTATALDAARTLLEALGRAGSLDPISRSIVESLSTCEELSISEVTRRVRRIRGTASRRIIAARLELLERRGIVERIPGSRPRYRLAVCKGDGGEGAEDRLRAG